MARTFVLDTCVLLADPSATLRFDEHQVVLPMVVVEELDRKKTRPDEVGTNARAALRLLEQLGASKRLGMRETGRASHRRHSAHRVERHRLGSAAFGARSIDSRSPPSCLLPEPGRRRNRDRARHQGHGPSNQRCTTRSRRFRTTEPTPFRSRNCTRGSAKSRSKRPSSIGSTTRTRFLSPTSMPWSTNSSSCGTDRNQRWHASFNPSPTRLWKTVPNHLRVFGIEPKNLRSDGGPPR